MCTYVSPMNADALISDLFKLSIQAQKTRSLKVRQVAKMRAGKIRKQLNEKPTY